MHLVLNIVFLVILAYGAIVYLKFPKQYLEKLNKEVNNEEIQRLKNTGYAFVVLFIVFLLVFINELVTYFFA